MRFLLLILSILWSVDSLKQLDADYEQCRKFYFCLLPTGVAQERTGDHLVVPVKLSPTEKPNIGIIIKPLTKHKWIFILFGKDINQDTGISLSKIDKTTPVSKLPQMIKSGVVIGCDDTGVHYDQTSLTYVLRKEDSFFDQNGETRCVGMLTSTGTKDIATILNEAQPAGHKLLVSYTKGLTIFVHPLVETSKLNAGGKFEFGDVNDKIDCDFDMLKPPFIALTHTHIHKAVNIYAETIDCKNNLFSQSDTALHLLIRPKPKPFEGNEADVSVDYVGIATQVDKITCKGKTLSYHIGTKTVEISDEAEVACGELIKCAMPKPVADCDESICAQPTIAKSAKCNAEKDKCDKIECPRWLINNKMPFSGEVSCRQESIEDKKGPVWYAAFPGFDSTIDYVRMETASCYKNIECRSIDTKCEPPSEDCIQAKKNATAIYCAANHDMMYKDFRGEDFMAEDFQCDLKTGTWNQKDILAYVNFVYCNYNRSKNNVLLGGEPLVLFEEDGKLLAEPYLFGAIGTIISVYVIIAIVVLSTIYVKRNMKRKAAERRGDRKQWTKDEKYKLRPPNRRNTKFDLRLEYKDLKVMKGKCIGDGMHFDFNLYSVEERVVFLENCLMDFPTCQGIVKETIPLLGKCTENDQGFIQYQPLHPATVRIAFKILKILCACYGHREDYENDARVRKAIAMRGRNITFKLGLSRVGGEDVDVTDVRVQAIEALMYANDQVTVGLLIKRYQDVRNYEHVETPLRKFVFAMGAKHGANGKGYDEVRKLFDLELEKVKAGKQAPDDTRFGDRLDHFIYALCAADRAYAETFLNYIIKDPYFTPRHIMIGFQAMLEVFDENQVAARFLFIDRHNFIKKKMAPTSPEYIQLWTWMYTYIIYFPANETWLWKFFTTEANFTLKEKEILNFNKALNYAAIYEVVFKWKGVVDQIEWTLMDKEYEKEDEMKPETESEKSIDWYDPDDPRDVILKAKRKAHMKKNEEEEEKVYVRRAERKKKEKERVQRELELERALRTGRALKPIDLLQVKTAIEKEGSKITSLKEQTAVGGDSGGSGQLEKTQSGEKEEKSSPIEKTQSEKPSSVKQNSGPAK